MVVWFDGNNNVPRELSMAFARERRVAQVKVFGILEIRFLIGTTTVFERTQTGHGIQGAGLFHAMNIDLS